MPRISIIVPAYNAAQYICDALDSIFTQTYRDFEVIVVDDGSTDDTKKRLENYGEKILYLFQENIGPSGARNKGIELARGEYIAFLDADDIWMPEKLELQVTLFEKFKNVGLVTCDALSFDENKIVVESMAKERPLHSGRVLEHLLKENFLNTNNVLIKKNVFDKVGLFDQRREFSEDYELWLRIAEYFEIGHVDEVLSKYRIHNLNRSKINKNKVMEAHLELVLQCIKRNRLNFFKKALILSHNYFKFGYNFFDEINMLEARKFFIFSFLNNPFNVKALLYLISSFFPKRLIDLIRMAKNK